MVGRVKVGFLGITTDEIVWRERHLDGTFFTGQRA